MSQDKIRILHDELNNETFAYVNGREVDSAEWEERDNFDLEDEIE